ncbi:TonB-dependent siderophore receptor [Comamonas sp. JUb58]|uniref:TonB-dependent siderophore receptor n=1 Tax=Comamonas sp. JUb58 TaxID=2485114 RepID=UPI00105F8CF2|nr:TonB-dependent siderophore receptor [Comamonas sp. JUb58]TDS83619.1 iron complex outermembrane receptor protein/outer membrane receptor for ferric coprogen and ferric-rhodotorulic acid [Comamonas sp. JUb58]
MNRLTDPASLAQRHLVRALRGRPIAIAVASLLGASGVYAQTLHSFSIPPGPLGTVLSQTAATAGVLLSVDAKLTQGIHSPGVQGRFSAEEGLARALAGSGLAAVPNAGGGYTLRAAPTAAPAPANPAATADNSTTLSTVVVSAAAQAPATTEGSGAYSARAATIGKTAQALKDIPQSVSVVTRQRMDDQNLSSVSDVLENTTGIMISEVADGGRNYYSRGFKIANVQYDGVPLSRGNYGVGNSFTGNAAYLDRVEVFRGAQGLFEGAGQPSGSINLVRKRPTADKQLLVEARAGSWSHYGGMLDASGPLNDEGSLRARAVLDYDDKGGFIDHTDEKNLNAYLALDYDLSADTTLGLGLGVSRLRSTPFFGGLPRYSDGRSLNLSRSTFLGADWNRWDRDETQLFADLSHRLNADWQFKVAAAYSRETSLTTVRDSTGAVDPVSLTGPEGAAWNYDKLSKNAGIDMHLNGRFALLGMPQQLTVGASLSRLRSNDRIAYAYNLGAIDVFNPNPHVPKPQDFPDSQRLSRYEPHLQKGIYAQLRTEIAPAWTLVSGGRVSWFESVFSTQAATWDSKSEQKKSGEFTPFLGLIYKLTPQWSAYASYADVFMPQTTTAQDGSTLKPVIGANYEAGIKGELLDGRLNASLAVYRVDETNRAVEDTAAGRLCNGNYCYRAAGKVRSQGFEAELQGAVAPGWQVAAGYTFNRNKYLSDPVNEGLTFNEDTPRHLLRLWSDYRFKGDWSGLSLGAGVSAQSAMSNSVSGVRRPSYGVWNTRIAYDLNRQWTLALNVNNVFDKVYYEYASYIENRNNYGTPRNFLVTLRGRF